MTEYTLDTTQSKLFDTTLSKLFDTTLNNLKNPRMSAGRIVLYSLLGGLLGDPVSPGKIRDRDVLYNLLEEILGDSISLDKIRDRDVSKQSITNAARRLEKAGIIKRTEGYSVNYGLLISVLLHKVMELTDSVSKLEEEVTELKVALK